MYQILIERAAEKDLKKIAAEERPKLATAMRDFANEPRPTGCRKLVGTLLQVNPITTEMRYKLIIYWSAEDVRQSAADQALLP